MIILEGCDGSGKTTLAKKLCQDLGFKYSKDGFHKEGINRYLHLSKNLSLNTVCDRFHWGERVYPIIKQDGRKPLDLWEIQLIDRILQNRKTFLILCHTDKEIIDRVFDERGEDFITKDDILINQEIYLEIFSESLVNKIIFDPFHDSYDDLLSMLKDQQQFNRSFEEFESIGNPYGKTMLIGDRYASGDWLGSKDFAFAHNINSSGYLHKALEHTSFPEQYYLTNAFKTENLENNIKLLFTEISNLEPEKIICLGNNSYSLIKKLIKHTGYTDLFQIIKVIPHPSYWRRFRHHDISIYSKLLQ